MNTIKELWSEIITRVDALKAAEFESGMYRTEPRTENARQCADKLYGSLVKLREFADAPIHPESGRTAEELWLETGKLRSQLADMKIVINKQGKIVTDKFTHPMMHIIDADKLVVLWHETYAASAWLADGQVISRGPASYKVIRHQPEVQNYYVWVRRVETA